jgi:hypothetical protein
MSMRNSTRSDVVIGGAGIAGAAMALRLLALGFRPTIVSVRRGIIGGIEAIPVSCLPLIQDLRLENAFVEAGGELVENFENEWLPDSPVLLPGRWLHIDRNRFAEAALREASARGTKILSAKKLPELAAIHRDYFAAVDATGRAAAWSRPIHRQGNQVADLFSVKSVKNSRARIVRLSHGWAYRIGLRHLATAGIVSPGAPKRRGFSLTIAARLGLEGCETCFLGRRPAFPQWCDNPLVRRRIAIGDAALAYDPIAGQGIRFAIVSAFAAASVLQTWRDGPYDPAARFYRNFVAQAVNRHLAAREQMNLTLPLSEPESLPEIVRFSGRKVKTEINVNSRIVMDDAILLQDRTAVRWVGGIDLLAIEELSRAPISRTSLMNSLVSLKLSHTRADALVRWCLRNHVLTSANPPSS